MAIAALPTVFKSFTFGGESSADYGVQILGEGVFNAPERAVELVSVPGRNGSIAIDQGYWENIEVTYPAVLIARNPEEFATAMANFRNMLCSKRGYCRLSDDYHPGEYRMAMFNNDIEVDEKVLRGGEFDITFNCKPQRWLTSGEVPVTIGEWGATKDASGEMVTIESKGGEAAKSLEVSLEPIQAGSGDPSPDNVRPISGRTSVETTRTGKNLLTYTEMHRTISGVSIDISADGVLHAYGTATAGLWVAVGEFEAKGGKTYFYGNLPRGMSTTTYFVTRYGSTGNTYEDSEYTFANDTNAVPRFYVRKDVTLDVTFKLVVADADTAQTYTTSLGRTVYGGTLDVVSGVLTVDRAMVDLTQGMSGGTISGNYLYYKQVSDAKTVPNSQIANVISEAYEPIRYNGVATSIGTIAIRDNKYLYVNTGGQDTLPTGNAVYELATPQTYQLTPQQVTLLVGENHLWSDGAITMQYGDDPNSMWNPTQYDAGPIVSAEGYGVIRFNGYEIDLEDMSFGDILLHNVYQSHNATQKLTIPFDRGFYRAGNAIKIYGLKIRSTVSPVSGRRFQRVTMDWNEDSPRTTPTLTSGVGSDGSAYFQMAWNTVSFDVDSTWTLEYITDQTIDVYGESLTLTDAGRKQTIIKTDDSIILDLTNFFTKGFSRFFSGHTYEISFERIVGHSTATLIDGADFRIDCELGEAFMIKNGVLSNLNGYVDLGSDLPKLKSGNNPVEADSTITKLVITPNWWKL